MTNVYVLRHSPLPKQRLLNPQPPFPIENFPLDHLRCVGEILSVFGALIFLYKTLRKWNLVTSFTQNIKLTNVITFKSLDKSFL